MWKWEAEGQPRATVVIVHNVYEYHRQYAWLIQKLRTSQFHVVMGDLPGHGAEVETSEYVHDKKIEVYTQYVQRLVEVGVSNELPLFIIGHGFGATLLIRLLQKQHIECAGVLVTSPWLHVKLSPPKYSSVLAKLTPSMSLNHQIEPAQLTRSEETAAELVLDEHYHMNCTAGWYRDITNFMRTVSVSERKIPDIPLLVHVPKEDSITTISDTKNWLLQQELSEFQYKEWQHLAHNLYAEPEREDVYAYFESFMYGVLRSLGYIIT